MNRPSPLMPALIGGSASAVASSIPLVNCLNLLCCALVIGGGFLASFLLSNQYKSAGLPFAAADGAKVGAIAGVVHGVVGGVISLAVRAIFGAPDIDEMLRQFEDQGAEIPEAARGFVEAMAGGGGVLVGLLMGVLVGVIFATIGGLIGGSVLKSEGASSSTTIDA